MTNKFNVGNRVIAVKNCSRYEIGETGVVKEFDKFDDLKPYRVSFGDYLFWASEDSLDFEKSTQSKIIITTTNKTTTAKLYENNKLIKSSEANCADSDTFDFGVGAKLAVDRLFEVEKKVEFKPYLKGMLTGDCYGIIGEDREIYDVIGNQLFIGDEVEVFKSVVSKGLTVVAKSNGNPHLPTIKTYPREDIKILKRRGYRDIPDGTKTDMIVYVKSPPKEQS